jgi:hypothetical protein
MLRCSPTPKFFSHFRLIGRSVQGRITASRASASAQSSSEADCHCQTMTTKSKQSLAHKSSNRSLRFKCNGLLHLNRGLPRTTVYDLSTVRQPEVRGEISPRIKCSSLRFKCNSLLYLNRGLPGSAVYDLSTVRRRESHSHSVWSARCQERGFFI